MRDAPIYHTLFTPIQYNICLHRARVSKMILNVAQVAVLDRDL